MDRTLNEKKKLLLHSCCGPCSTAVIERLLPDWDICVFYYNPNITDPAEYEHRLSEQKRFIAEFREKTGADVAFIEGRYEPSEFYDAVKGLEGEPEGGARCRECFRLRLAAAAAKAAELGFDCFDTTLSVSPYKNYDTIAAAAAEVQDGLSAAFGGQRPGDGSPGDESSSKLPVYLGGNYKKKEGYKRSIELAREYGLYRQHYCGCGFSKREAEEAMARKAAQNAEGGDR